MAENRGGYRPTASQNNTGVSATGGAGSVNNSGGSGGTGSGGQLNMNGSPTPAGNSLFCVAGGSGLQYGGGSGPGPFNARNGGVGVVIVEEFY